MDPQRNDLLGELASDAALERSDFLAVAGEQLGKFIDANRRRIGESGGIVLIDEDPDYLAVAPDLTFRSRSRYQDADTGQWVSETEVIESAAELVELYNPADLYQWFAEAAREAAGLAPEPTGNEDVLEAANVASEDAPALDVERGYAEAADQWAARQPGQVETEDQAAGALYDLAVDFLERSQQTEAGLLAKYEDMAESISPKLGDLIIVDDEDERLILTASGSFRAEVVPEGANGEWKMLTTPEELVEYYDPTDVFGDLADALAEGFPSIDQPGEAAAAGDEGSGEEGSGEEGSGEELDEEPEKS